MASADLSIFPISVSIKSVSPPSLAGTITSSTSNFSTLLALALIVPQKYAYLFALSPPFFQIITQEYRSQNSIYPSQNLLYILAIITNKTGIIAAIITCFISINLNKPGGIIGF